MGAPTATGTTAATTMATTTGPTRATSGGATWGRCPSCRLLGVSLIPSIVIAKPAHRGEVIGPKAWMTLVGAKATHIGARRSSSISIRRGRRTDNKGRWRNGEKGVLRVGGASVELSRAEVCSSLGKGKFSGPFGEEQGSLQLHVGGEPVHNHHRSKGLEGRFISFDFVHKGRGGSNVGTRTWVLVLLQHAQLSDKAGELTGRA